MTPRTNGRNAASWRRTQRQARRSSLRSARRVQEIAVPKYVDVPAPAATKPLLFATGSQTHDLLGFGVPREWLADVRGANEDTLSRNSDHLPGEAAEALLDLATGGAPVARAGRTVSDPFEHPDAQRRFRVMKNIEELQPALDYPWEKWAVFLHPAQRQLVEKDFNGPAQSCRFGRHWQDDRRPAPRSPPRPCEPGLKSASDDVLRHAGECAPNATAAPHR